MIARIFNILILLGIVGLPAALLLGVVPKPHWVLIVVTVVTLLALILATCFEGDDYEP